MNEEEVLKQEKKDQSDITELNLELQHKIKRLNDL